MGLLFLELIEDGEFKNAMARHSPFGKSVSSSALQKQRIFYFDMKSKCNTTTMLPFWGR